MTFYKIFKTVRAFSLVGRCVLDEGMQTLLSRHAFCVSPAQFETISNPLV